MMCLQFLASIKYSMDTAYGYYYFPYKNNFKPLHFSKLKSKLYKKWLHTQNRILILSASIF